MKNKGFTLLELLGVMIILAILVTLVFPSVINFIKSSTSKKEKLINELIVSAAESYVNDNSENLYLTSGNNYCVTVDTLVETQYLNSVSELDNYPKESKSVKVIYDDGYKYELVDSDSCFVCKLVSDSDGSKSLTIGDKYQCKVKDEMEEGFEDGYNFFVLSYNSDGTTNLIMERNMYYDSVNDVGKVATEINKGLVDWYLIEVDNSYGPVIAMQYLHDATKDWNNVPNMIMNYEDENVDYSTQQKGTSGYGSIKTTGATTVITSKTGEETGKIENLKARMPRYDEVHGINKCLTYKENGDQYGSCLLWLVNYLNNSSYITGEGLQNISGIYGYWTLSSSAEYSDRAWDVHYYGSVNDYDGDDVIDSDYGVRPVITISNGLILE